MATSPEKRMRVLPSLPSAAPAFAPPMQPLSPALPRLCWLPSQQWR